MNESSPCFRLTWEDTASDIGSSMLISANDCPSDWIISVSLTEKWEYAE